MVGSNVKDEFLVLLDFDRRIPNVTLGDLQPHARFRMVIEHINQRQQALKIQITVFINETYCWK